MIKKRYKYFVYNSSKEFITEYNDVIDDPEFSSYINFGPQEITIRRAVQATNFGEDTEVAYGNQIKVYCYDRDSTAGICIFNGYISKYVPYIKDKEEGVSITCLSYLSHLNRTLLTGEASRTALPYNSYDPSDILKSVINHYRFIWGGTVDQEYDTGGGNSNIGGVGWRAQQFTTGTGVGQMIIAGVSLSMKWTNGTAAITVGIQGDNGSDKPDGTDLVSKTFVGITNTDYKMIDVIFDEPYQLVGNTKYHIVVRSPSGANGDYLWEYDSSGSYTGGNRLISSDSGSTWTIYAGEDLKFKTYYIDDDKCYINYNDDSIDDTSTTVSYTFNTFTGMEALNKILELCPDGWYCYLDSAGLIQLHAKPGSADHTFTIGKDINAISPEKRTENIINKIYFTGNGLYKVYARTGSISTYGLWADKYVDERVSITGTADIIAGRILDKNQDPEVRTIFTVLDNNGENSGKGYNIENINVGDTCKILGFSKESYSRYGTAQFDVSKWDYSISDVTATTMQIIRINYKPDLVEIEASNKIPDISKRVEDIVRNVQQYRTKDNSETTPPVEE